MGGNGNFDFGNSVTVNGANSTGGNGWNAVLAKYDSSGNAQWARSTASGSNDSWFSSIAIDPSGSLYVVGSVYGSGTYGFGSGVTASGSCSTNENALLVKYDISGNAKWAKSTTNGPSNSRFSSVIRDPNGDIYAAGYVGGNYNYGFGNNVSTAGLSSNGNALLVKYNSDGNAQWAKSTTSGTDGSIFRSMVIDKDENICAVGYINGSNDVVFGNGATAKGVCSGSCYSALLVKYGDLPPTLTNFTKSAHENAIISFAANDFISHYGSSLNNSLAKVKIISLPTNGTLKLPNGAVAINQEIPIGNIDSLTHIPNTGFLGTDSFNWNGNDGLLYAANYTNVNLIINDQAPTLSTSPIVGSCNENGTISFTKLDFTSRFTGYQGNSLNKIQIVDLPQHGTLSYSGTTVTTPEQEIPAGSLNSLIYTPYNGYFGPDSFIWNGSDGTFYAGSPATVNLTISDQAPTLLDVSRTGYSITFAASDFTSKFTSANSLAKIRIASLPTNGGTLKYQGNTITTPNVQEIPVGNINQLVYTPSATSVNSGSDSFTWNGSDGTLYAEKPANVNLTITYTKPTLSKVTRSVTEGGTFNFSASDFSQSFHGGTGNLTYIKIISQPSHGSLLRAGATVALNTPIPVSSIGDLSYTANEGYADIDRFYWNGSDGMEESAETAAVEITVTDEVPSVTDFTRAGPTNTAITFVAEEFEDNFAGYKGNKLATIKITEVPTHGVLQCNGNTISGGEKINVTDLQSLTYMPYSNYSGPDSFKWNGSDSVGPGQVWAIADATVSLNISNSSKTGAIIGGIVGGVGGTAAIVSVITGGVFLYTKVIKPYMDSKKSDAPGMTINNVINIDGGAAKVAGV